MTALACRPTRAYSRATASIRQLYCSGCLAMFAMVAHGFFQLRSAFSNSLVGTYLASELVYILWPFSKSPCGWLEQADRSTWLQSLWIAECLFQVALRFFEVALWENATESCERNIVVIMSRQRNKSNGVMCLGEWKQRWLSKESSRVWECNKN